MPANHIAAKNQLVLSPYQTPALNLPNRELSNVESTAPIVKENDRNYLIISGDGFRAEFNKHSGYLTQYELAGQEMIKEGAALTPNFWRAPTDNDFGAHIHQKIHRLEKARNQADFFQATYRKQASHHRNNL